MYHYITRYYIQNDNDKHDTFVKFSELIKSSWLTLALTDELWDVFCNVLDENGHKIWEVYCASDKAPLPIIQ